MAEVRKLTVLFVNNSYSVFGGATRSLFDLIESAKDMITPIVLLKEKGAVYEYLTSRGVECIVHNFSSIVRPSLHYSITKGKLLTHPWRYWLIKVVRHDISCVRFVKREMRDRRIDLVHSNTTTVVIGYKIARVLGVKHVWHVRENLVNEYFGKEKVVRSSLARKLVFKTDARIVISNSCKKYWGFTDINTWVLPDAVRFREDCCYIKEKEPYYLFCTWGLCEAKGASFAIRAFGLSGMAAKGMSLKLVGNASDDYIAELKGIASEYGCEDSVSFMLLQDDVKTLYAHATAFLQPSENEGMGRTTVEAMFYGCPVIGRASGGTSDLIEDGETGYLFNTDEECAELMKRVCSDNQSELILKAQDCVKHNCSIEDYGDKLIHIYNTVLQ